jgi:hypothetical protein
MNLLRAIYLKETNKWIAILTTPNNLKLAANLGQHMKTTFRELVASSLLAVCSETTVNMHNKIEQEKKRVIKYSKEKMEEARRIFRHSLPTGFASDIKDGHVNAFFKTLAYLLDAPELDPKGPRGQIQHDPFTVIVITQIKDEVLVEYEANKPIIVTNGKNRSFLRKNGEVYGSYFAVDEENYRLATPNEIQQCIQDLNDSQWKTILVNDLFSPIVNDALNTEVKVTDSISIEPENTGTNDEKKA